MTPLALDEYDGLSICEVIGSGAAAVLQEAGLPVPESAQTALPHGAGLVACTGRDDYLVVSEAEELPATAPPPWLLARSDQVLRLRGEGWEEAMTQLCPHDLRRLPEGGWLAASVAGVSAWLYRHPGVPDGILLGFDPSYGTYLRAMLEAVVHDHRHAPDNT